MKKDQKNQSKNRTAMTVVYGGKKAETTAVIIPMYFNKLIA